MPGLARVCACPRFPSILARAFIANSLQRLPWSPRLLFPVALPWSLSHLLSLRLIMAPDSFAPASFAPASFAPAFDFACSRLSDSEPLTADPAVVAFDLACSRSSSMQKHCSAFCVVFVFIFTKISIISAILYPKTYKMHVILHFFLKIFGSFK